MKEIISPKEARDRVLKIMEEREVQERKTRLKDCLEDSYLDELRKEFIDRESVLKLLLISKVYEFALIILIGMAIYTHFFGNIVIDGVSDLIGWFLAAGFFKIFAGFLERAKTKENKKNTENEF